MGSIIGLAAGMLFAPQAGRESRERLRGRFDELTSLGKSAWEEGKETAAQRASEIQAKFSRARRKEE